MHPDTNNTHCYSNVDNNSHCQSNVENVTGTSSTATWGIYDTETLRQNIELVYEKVVYWRQNLFKLPSGAAGKAFIREITRLVSAWNSKSNLADIAWKAVMIMPSLLLQKPAANSKAKDHREALRRRLSLWEK